MLFVLPTPKNEDNHCLDSNRRNISEILTITEAFPYRISIELHISDLFTLIFADYNLVFVFAFFFFLKKSENYFLSVQNPRMRYWSNEGDKYYFLMLIILRKILAENAS